MKIIFTTFDWIDNPYYGGGGAFSIYELTKRLKTIHDITILTSKHKSSRNYRYGSATVRYIGIDTGHPQLNQALYPIFLYLEIKKQNADLIIETLTPPACISLIPLIKYKTIGLVHSLPGEQMFQKYKLPFHIIERVFLKFYRNFIVLKYFDMQKIIKINRRANYAIIPNGVNIPKLNLFETPKDDFEYILYFGRIDLKTKGIDTLVKAYTQFNNQSLKLLIVGGGSNKEIKNLMKIISHNKNILYKGKIIDDSKFQYIKCARMVVLPSRFETFPMVALECLALGKVPLCSNIEGHSWITDDISFKFEPDNPIDLANKIKYYLENEAEVIAKQSNIKKFITEYTWNSIASLYNKFFTEVVTQ